MPGVFLGDHVKGKLTGHREPKIEMGIRFHRAVDAYVDDSQFQRKSIARMDQKFRRYGGIICDIAYDYYLAKNWQFFSPEDLNDFCQRAYAAIRHRDDELGSRALQTVTRMQQFKSLENYGTRDYVARSLQHISTRLSRENPLASAFTEFEKHDQGFAEDFFEFMPDVVQFGDEWLTQTLQD